MVWVNEWFDFGVGVEWVVYLDVCGVFGNVVGEFVVDVFLN